MPKQLKQVKVGNIRIGAGAPVSIQSMTKTLTTDVKATVAQAKELTAAGCQIVRIAIPDEAALKAFAQTRKKVPNVPLVADIHFDWRLAVGAAQAGADKLRINPGNIGSIAKIKAVINAAKKARIPIRIGVNAGSLPDLAKVDPDRILPKNFAASLWAKTKKYQACGCGGLLNGLAEHKEVLQMVEATLYYTKIFEHLGFGDLVLAAKSSRVPVMIETYRRLAYLLPYPLHLGVTEAGPLPPGLVKSAVGIGTLLAEGIGDTIRVSLTAPPVEEVQAAYDILKSLGLYSGGADITSCPTCGRCQIDIFKIVQEVTKATRHIKKPINLAIMGCVVNGPGEAKQADLGIAGGRKSGVIFRRGKVLRTVSESCLVKDFLRELAKF